MMKWKIKKEEKVYSSKLFDVYKQYVLSPKNHEKEYDVIKRKPTVSIIPLDKNSIYIAGQERYLLGKYTWELFAGFIDEGEKPLDAAKRELQEEAGIIAKNWKKIVIVDKAASVIKAVSHIFIASSLSFTKTNQDENEDITVKKITISDAVNMVINGTINNSVSMVGILMVDTLLKKGKL